MPRVMTGEECADADRELGVIGVGVHLPDGAAVGPAWVLFQI